jgi:uncharacterized protein
MNLGRQSRRAPTAIVALGILLSAGAARSAPSELPTRQLTAGLHLITAEVAASEQDRIKGLMFRRELGPNHGMLFIFDAPEKVCMWMRNTLIPLSVAFIDADGRIVNIEDMEPGSEALHCASHELPYALEMDRGWFSSRGLKPGRTVIGGLPQARPIPSSSRRGQK